MRKKFCAAMEVLSKGHGSRVQCGVVCGLATQKAWLRGSLELENSVAKTVSPYGHVQRKQGQNMRSYLYELRKTRLL